uniref:Uncharacterized protein n=1 Tax=Ascaris lumbricoides TaxID=6252 RepID=A0A9J2PXT1_ASCLU
MKQCGPAHSRLFRKCVHNAIGLPILCHCLVEKHSVEEFSRHKIAEPLMNSFMCAIARNKEIQPCCCILRIS